MNSSGNPVLNNSNSMAKGTFHKPDTVLDAIAKATPTNEGVVVISSRDISGRIGVNNNSIVIGAVVDRTGETGIAAVCRLLLLPAGSFQFRAAVPMDQWHLQQELNLHFKEVKKFLSGPASIGLAAPADHALKREVQTSSQRLLRLSPNFSWETTEFRSQFQGAEPEASPYTWDGDSSENPDYLQDCNQLLNAVDKKRTFELQLAQLSKSSANLEVLTPGPLPSRKEPVQPISPLWVVAGALVLLGVGGFTMLSTYFHSDPASSQGDVLTAFTQPIGPAGSSDATAKTAEPEPKKDAVSTPYDLPAGPPPPGNAPTPADPQPAAEDNYVAPVIQPDAVPVSSGAPAGGQEVNQWLDKVRKNPADADARRELSHAYLVAGNANASIEQFYAVMRLRHVDNSEVITYADNLMAFSGKDIARQFLSDVLRSDPARSEIRERLQSPSMR